MGSGARSSRLALLSLSIARLPGSEPKMQLVIVASAGPPVDRRFHHVYRLIGARQHATGRNFKELAVPIPWHGAIERSLTDEDRIASIDCNAVQVAPEEPGLRRAAPPRCEAALASYEPRVEPVVDLCTITMQ